MSNPTSSDTPSGTTDIASTMPPLSSASPLSLTLILAATPSLGIGKAGTLPWPQLRKEMGYFKRVTMHVSPQQTGRRKRMNAVVMGRKTWDSIPARFRPLEGRLNVVVTRKPEMFSADEHAGDKAKRDEGPIAVGSVTEALEKLQAYDSGTKEAETEQDAIDVETVFVIGGATIYDAALKLPQTNRVLLTKIHDEFECDTFFSVDLDKDEGWRRSSQEKLEELAGERIEALEEKGVKFEFSMYERVGSGEGR